MSKVSIVPSNCPSSGAPSGGAEQAVEVKDTNTRSEKLSFGVIGL